MKIVVAGLLAAVMLGAAVLPDTSGEMPAESASMPAESVSASESLPDAGGGSESLPDEMDADTSAPEGEPVPDPGEDDECDASAEEETPDADSESVEDESTEESEADPDAEDSAGDEPPGVILSDEYAAQIAGGQADSIMGHLGMTRDTACTQAAAVIALSDYTAPTEDEAYFRVWEATNAVLVAQAASGAAAAHCIYENGSITVYV